MENISDKISKDAFPGSWDDDELIPKKDKKRARTPAGQSGAAISATKSSKSPVTPTNKVVKRVQKQCFKEAMKGEGHTLIDLENKRDIERKNLLLKAEELRKKTELERKMNKKEKEAK